jgi:hypothetical protein
MLFSYNNFWKTVTLMLACWGAYVVWGYEFTTVTLLAALLITQWNQK